jgi:hypothetical protein
MPSETFIGNVGILVHVLLRTNSRSHLLTQKSMHPIVSPGKGGLPFPRFEVRRRIKSIF